MIVFTLLTVLIGDFSLKSWTDARWLFLYPTNYIFIVWLMLLYIPFYIVAWLSKKYEKTTEITLAAVLVAWILTYFIFVDKSVYHIDNVEKPFILFLYFSSMLMGALFKKYMDRFNKVKILNVVLLFVSFIIYFGSKIAFSKIQSIAFCQILNQVSILAVLYFTFAVFISLEDRLNKIPKWINNVIKFVARMTLHIYIVQFVLIRRLEGMVFPVNFLVTTVAIFALACALYYAEFFIKKGIILLIDKIRGNRKNAESND